MKLVIRTMQNGKTTESTGRSAAECRAVCRRNPRTPLDRSRRPVSFGSCRALPRIRLAAVLLAVAALVSACTGGGGGGGGEGEGGGGGTGSRCVGTALFGCLVARQWGLGRIRAEPAWQRISRNAGRATAPGAGQTVGVIDDGIDQGNGAFCKSSGSTCTKTVTEQFLAGATDQTGSEVSHGTGVASVIVGRLDSAPGVAWGADVVMFAVPTGTSSGNHVPISLTGLNNNDDGWAAIFNAATGWSSGGRTLDFVNVSLGFSGMIDQYSEADLRANFDAAIAALAQSGVTDKTVFVFSGGNAHGQPCDQADYTGHLDLCESYVENGVTKFRVNAKSVGLPDGLPARISELRGHVIAVVAVGRDGRIASFSNRCGIAAQWCLAAPGAQIRTAYFGPHPNTREPGARGDFSASGASYAAPLVTGALVVMKHYFRDSMSNTELVTRLLDTANDSGIYAVSAIYGHGLLDLDAATKPAGATDFVAGKTVGSPGSPVIQTRFSLGHAFGNALTLSFAGQEIAAFDSLGAPFWYRLGGFARAAPRASAFARLDSFMAPEAWAPRAAAPDDAAGPGMIRVAGTARAARGPSPPLLGGFAPAGRAVGWPGLRFGFVDAPAAGLGGGHLALARGALAFDADGPGGLGFTAFSTERLRGRAPVSGALLSWRAAPNGSGGRTAARTGLPLKLTAGWMVERETMLGSRPAGAFGHLSAGSAFLGFDGSMQVGGWRVNAAAEFGMAYTRAGGGMLTGVSPLYSSAFAMRAERPLNANSSLQLSVSQPLRIETGRARFSVPVGRTKDRRVLRRSLAANLAPGGRQIDLSARWRTRLDTGGELRLGAAWTLDPGHDAAAPSEVTVLAGLRHSF